MSKSITQNMAYRQSLMKYVEKYGVSRASRKYNKSQPYIYFWRAGWDGNVESLDFLKRLVKWYARKGIHVEYVQTDNGFEFTNRFSNSKRDIPTLFEKTAAELGVQHKLIRPYTPRHNGKVERSHREDQKRFYSLHSFFSLPDFQKQLAVHNRRSNNLPMRPLAWLSPLELLVQFL